MLRYAYRIYYFDSIMVTCLLILTTLMKKQILAGFLDYKIIII